MKTWWFVRAPAQRLAALRALVGSFGVVYLLARAPALVAVASYDAARFEPVGPWTWLPSPIPSAGLVVLFVLALLSGVGFTTGYRYRALAPFHAAALLLVLSYRNAWGMVFHTENLLVLHTLALACAPAADAFSLDARAGRTHVRDEELYGWPIRLLQVMTVGAYFIAGLTKIRTAGWGWIVSDTLRNHVAFDNVRKIELGTSYSWLGAEALRYRWLFPPLAGFSLLLELGAPLALFHRRVGQVWAAAMWSFHLGVLALMAIFFPYPLLGVGFAPFFRVERLLPKLMPERWRSRST